jgi:hypothetical protein
VHSGDLVDSDGSKHSPNSAVSDEDEDKKLKVARTKSPFKEGTWATITYDSVCLQR